MIVTAPRYLLEVVLIVFVVSLVLVTVWSGLKVDTIIPTLSLFGVAAIRLLPSANLFISGLSRIRFGSHAVKCLVQDLKKANEQLIVKKINRRNSFNHKTFESLKLQNVSFTYPDANFNSLNNISMNIKKGESIGIIGSSGSGKTTLIDTMLGLLEPQHGEILFNKTALQDDLYNWRANVAYLPQQVLLIDDTLRSNVAFGVLKNEIDEKQLNLAIQQARLLDLVNQLPEGVNTILGERGVRLSGGQRQRVALARAFYHDRNILIMDESTSALDNETEKEIVNEIKQLKGLKTLIVIAHRLSTVAHCDRLYCLENGSIIKEGSPEKVLR